LFTAEGFPLFRGFSRLVKSVGGFFYFPLTNVNNLDVFIGCANSTSTREPFFRITWDWLVGLEVGRPPPREGVALMRFL
jgi:hypothetical protein